MSPHIVDLAQASVSAGGKARSLRRLIEAGYPVPAGMVVLPEATRDTVAAALAGFVLPGRRYAVRSSANVEDGDRWSFAGQFRTVLGVEGDAAVAEAVESVRLSAADPALAPYLDRAGMKPGEIRMAVIVQEMVEATTAGVAFSRNPVTGLNEVVVESVAGLGDGLVAGTETPHRWVRRWGAWTSRPDGSPVPETVAARVADLVAEVAARFDHAVDMEWAAIGDEVLILQVRPQTTGRVPVYSNRISREVLPGMIKPLVWSVNVPVVNAAWIDLFTRLVGPTDLTPDDLARSFAYRAYFNMQAIGDIFETLGMPRDLLEVLMGLEGGDDRPGFRPGLGVVRHLPRMARTGVRALRYRSELDRVLPELERAFDRMAAEPPDTLTDGGLLERLDTLSELSQRAAFANILAPLVMSAHHRRFRRRAIRAGFDPETIDPAAGDPALAAYDPNPGLDRLAAAYAGLDADDVAELGAGRWDRLPGFVEFLDRFGHVSDSGNDFSSVPWRETPERVLELIAARPERTGTPPAPPPGRLARAARTPAAFRVARERVSYTYTRGYGLHRPTVLEAGRRLVDRGVLGEPTDVFYLTRSELEGLLGRGTPPPDPAAAVAERRKEMVDLAAVSLPEVIYGDDFAPAPPADPDHTLGGLATSRGIHTGVARVVRSVSEAPRVAAGDVLVIPHSDVAWTAMFATAGAVVAEAGGMLSHSSIVAREFGIPCVVSVDGAMRIPEGSTVRVDGYTGDVRWT